MPSFSSASPASPELSPSEPGDDELLLTATPRAHSPAAPFAVTPHDHGNSADSEEDASATTGDLSRPRPTTSHLTSPDDIVSERLHQPSTIFQGTRLDFLTSHLPSYQQARQAVSVKFAVETIYNEYEQRWPGDEGRLRPIIPTRIRNFRPLRAIRLLYTKLRTVSPNYSLAISPFTLIA